MNTLLKGDYIEIVNLQTAPGTSGSVSTIGVDVIMTHK